MRGVVVAVPARKGTELAGDFSFFYCSREGEEMFITRAKVPITSYRIETRCL